jgi:hypothetical protein
MRAKRVLLLTILLPLLLALGQLPFMSERAYAAPPVCYVVSGSTTAKLDACSADKLPNGNLEANENKCFRATGSSQGISDFTEVPQAECANLELASGAACTPVSSISFLGLPTWYKYLPGKTDIEGNCIPQLRCDSTDANKTCSAKADIDVSKIWLIGFAVLELLLRLGGTVAVGIVIYGGIRYIISQGNPDATKTARRTIINAFVGIVITILATISVNFVAKLLQ